MCFLTGLSHELFLLTLLLSTCTIFPLGHSFTPWSVFAHNFEFAAIFEFEVDSAVSVTPPSQNFSLRQPYFFLLGPPLAVYLPIVGLGLIMFSKSDSLLKFVKLTQSCQQWLSGVNDTIESWPRLRIVNNDSVVSMTPPNHDSAVSRSPLGHDSVV